MDDPQPPAFARTLPQIPTDQADSPGKTNAKNDPEREGIGIADAPLAPAIGELPGTHVDPKKASLVTLAALAVAYTLYFAQAILLPIFLAFVLALLFRPVVRRLRKYRVPESAAAGGVIIFVLLVLGFGVYQVSGPATEFVNNLPEQLDQADSKVRAIVRPFKRINEALKTGEDLVSGNVLPGAENPDGVPNVPSGPKVAGPTSAEAKVDGTPDPIVVNTQQQPRLTDVILSATSSFVAGALLCLILLYFLLASGDDVLNNVLRTLPTMREKRGVVELVHAAEKGMSQYLLTVATINFGLGICEGVAMLCLGVPNALLWGAMACVFNFIPYVGAIAGMGVVGLVSFLHFDSVGYALLPPLVYICLTGVEGNFITPTILGNRISLNPVVVFLALAFWGWIWGAGGAIIAVPLLSMAKIVCDQFAPLQSLATLIGANEEA